MSGITWLEAQAIPVIGVIPSACVAVVELAKTVGAIATIPFALFAGVGLAIFAMCSNNMDLLWGEVFVFVPFYIAANSLINVAFSIGNIITLGFLAFAESPSMKTRFQKL